MKKFIVSISIILNVILLFFAVPAITDLFQESATHSQLQGHDKKARAYRVAILTPVTHPSLEKIEQGFKDTLTSLGKHKYTCDVFNAGGNKTLLRAQAEEIVQKDYDLIFTIATQPAQLIKELCTKKGKKTPIVFGAADEPVRLGLVQSLEQPGGTMTGVVDGAEQIKTYTDHIDLLLTIKPSIKSVLLVYSPGTHSGLEHRKETYKKLLADRGISLNALEIFNTNEIYGKAAALIAGNDAVLVLKDNTVVAGIDGLIKLCNMHHVTLMCSDLDSGDKGAALSYGVYEDQFGIQGAHLALKILEEGASPATLACVPAGNHKLKINTKTMVAQGLSLPEELILLLKSVVIV